MKICPQCHKTYSDDNLNFCLDDGSVLKQASGNLGQNDYGETLEMNRPDTDSQNDDLPETVMINQGRHTSQNAGFSQGFGGTQQQNQSNWGRTPTPPLQPAGKSSKSWLWVVGILGVLAILCGGGFIGFLALMSGGGNTDWNSDFEKNVNSGATNSRSIDTDKTSPTPDDRRDVVEVDMKTWVRGENDFGVTEFESGEFFMNAQKEGYYYVIAAPAQYQTENATTRITVRNVANADTNLGFGLIVHSDPTPLQKDYAFLIDSEKQRFRIVRHTPKNELTVFNWTNADVIKTGSQENVLEVRDDGSKMDFYINGLKVTTQTNVFGFKGGVAGIYTGTDSPIAYSDLEIRR